MNTCKECKYWDDEPYPSEPPTPLRQCSNEKLHSSEDSDGLDCNADTWYYSYTGPDFGCVHWEKK